MDLAKYRAIFIEEATEHFAEMSGALLELEKNPASVESIDVVFRMAHSIKGMAASLGYDTLTDLSHRMEDRMQVIRDAGRVRPGRELSLLFRSLSALEEMVEVVKTSDDLPGPPPSHALDQLGFEIAVEVGVAAVVLRPWRVDADRGVGGQQDLVLEAGVDQLL